MANQPLGSFPGMVTSNITQSGGYPTDWSQATAQYNLQQRMEEDKKREWARAAAQNNARFAAAQPRPDPEAKMRNAYAMIYGPTLQSYWDMSQGRVGGVQRPGMTPTNTVAYQKPSGPGQMPGQYPYTWRPDTNMPSDRYSQSMNYGYEMWKAAQMMGMKPTTEFRGNISYPQYPAQR